MKRITPEELGRRITELRGFRPQTKLALQARIDKATLNRLESGKNRNPSPATIHAVAEALGIDPALLTDPEAKLFSAQVVEKGSHVSGDLTPVLKRLDELEEKFKDVLAVARDARAKAEHALSGRAPRTGRRSQ